MNTPAPTPEPTDKEVNDLLYYLETYPDGIANLVTRASRKGFWRGMAVGLGIAALLVAIGLVIITL